MSQTGSYYFTTFAGQSGYGAADGDGSDARFDVPRGVAVDGTGNVYVADRFSHTIRKISPAGTVTTLAGLAGNSGGTDGAGSAARFQEPWAVAVDTAGNVYVAEFLNHTIRKITPSGTVSTLAGLAGSSGTVNGAGSAARFNGPSGVAVDGAGFVYVADTGSHTIRKITPAGTVSTLAGTAGSFGNTNGTGAAARFNFPSAVAVDGAGTLYVTDLFNHTIRVVTAAGAVSTLAGQAGSPGAADGTGGSARFAFPAGVALEPDGAILVADEANHTIRRVTTAGVVTTVAGFALARGDQDATGTGARFNGPGSVAVDNAGNAFVADTGNITIRKMTPARAVTTFAGLSGGRGSDNGVGTASRFSRPHGIAVHSDGSVFIADTDNSTIRKISSAGVVETFAGSAGIPGSANGAGVSARFNTPEGVAVDAAGNVYVADSGSHTIRKITPEGTVSTLAGQAGSFGSASGTGAAARFEFPSGIAVDPAGTVYVADTYNHIIRKITPAGAVTTLAGLAGNIGATNGTGAAARFSFPYGIAVDAGGNVFVCDSGLDGVGNSDGHVIRTITPGGVVTTLAGLAGARGAADGAGAAARFHFPFGLALDGAGNLFVSEYLNNVIRRVTPAGVVTTVGGPPGGASEGLPYNLDGVGSAARFHSPYGVAVSNTGVLYVADTFNNTIRKAVLASARLVNLSVRSNAGTGGQTLIVGLSVGGAGSKQILLRGIGPTLIDYGVTTALVDPRLTLFDAANAPIQENNDWGGGTQLAAAFATVGAFELEALSKDAALLANLPAGSYTAQITSAGETGIALAEAYDIDVSPGAARLTNISARTVVGTGGEVLIVGFVVAGDGPASVLIRAVGPGLVEHGVTGFLIDPRLDVYSGGVHIGGSDNWQSVTLSIPAEVVGAFELDPGSKDAGLLATLYPGEYTVQASGVGGTSGVALVELYELP